jgi:hypothetical protein
MHSKLIAALLLLLLIGFSACKKCQTCEVKDSQGNSLEEKELCGNDEQLSNQKIQAQIKATNIGGTYLCVEN